MPLDAAAIDERLGRMDGWVRSGNAITKSYTFPGFREAIEFVNRVAAAAEDADHHPDILVEYTKVTLRLSTHSEGGVTSKDLDLAARIG